MVYCGLGPVQRDWEEAWAGGMGPAVLPVLQPLLARQVPCVPQERESAEDGLEQGAYIFPDACRVPSSARGWGQARCLFP